MSEFYKMEPLRWDRGTDNLTLEQEAAYLRVCNAIYAADQPIAENYRALAGMWRCNERKAKRLLAELIEAGKLYVADGLIRNDKAMADIEKRNEMRGKRQASGRLGGIKSGEVRASLPSELPLEQCSNSNSPAIDEQNRNANTLENKATSEASGSSRREENKKSSVAKATGGETAADFFDRAFWRNGLAFLVTHGVKEKNARAMLGRWRKQSGDIALFEALKRASAEDAIDPVAYITAALKPKLQPADQKLESWGIGDAQPLRIEPRPADLDPEPPAGTTNLSRVQPYPEEQAGTLSFGDADIGWGGGVLPSLRLVCGGQL